MTQAPPLGARIGLTSPAADGWRVPVGGRLNEFGFRCREGSFDVAGPVLLPGRRDGLAGRVESALADLPRGHVAVGALPFERSDAWLGHGTPARPGRRPEMDRPSPVGIVEEPGATYEHQVRQALDRIRRAGDLHKVVLSRRIRLDFDHPVARSAVLATLAAQHPTAWSFSVGLTAPEGETGWVGASPELLLRKRGRLVESVPLAGTVARPPGRRADRTARDGLRTSGKDRREHAWVVQAIADTLAPYCRRLEVPGEPAAMAAGGLWHLGTRIVGELRDRRVSSLALVDQLHPTPALGGWPRAAAQQAVAEIEGRPRGLYGGAVGWCDSSGNGTWVVAIRCAQITGRSMWAHAGAGIVVGSEPAAELAETTAKLRTMLNAVGGV